MTTDEAHEATAAARWLLEKGLTGIPLTQTHALARSVVREGVERWPWWWPSEVFGPPNREMDVNVLQELDDGLRRLRLVRRRGLKLLTTKRGRELAEDPVALLGVLARDLGGGDAPIEVVARMVVERLKTTDGQQYDQLVAAVTAALQYEGWRRPDGSPPDERDVSWVVSEVLVRGEAYGLLLWSVEVGGRRRGPLGVTLTPAGRMVLTRWDERADGAAPEVVAGEETLVFDAVLQNVKGVRARVAVGVEQPLTALHDAIQEAFGWYDDHLYSFWLDGVFWGHRDTEYATPDVDDVEAASADVPIGHLSLTVGSKIAYVFDYGDEWRVRLTVRALEPADDDPYPRVISRHGEAPPQYPALDEE